MDVLIITTGGTIGAIAAPNPQKPAPYSSFPPNRNTVIETLEKLDNAARKVGLEPRDSKDVDDTYLEKIVTTIQQSPERAILITHGTDKLISSAEFLYQKFVNNLQDKMIILTGSMIPLLNGPESDGYANLQFSIEQLETFLKNPSGKAGVYIVLCDYTENNAWQPHLYRVKPDLYEKFHAEDARFSRLRKRG